MNILTISDALTTITPVVDALRGAQYSASLARSDDAQLDAKVGSTQLVILHWDAAGAPDATIENLHRCNPGVPVFVLLGTSARMDTVAALDAGADDCVHAPFVARELLARVRALARRCAGELDTLKRGPIVINQRTRQAWLNGDVMTLNVREFSILTMLVRRADQLVTRREILAEVWQRSRPPTSNLIEVYIRHLRSKLGSVAGNLQTVRGKGYVFVTQ